MFILTHTYTHVRVYTGVRFETSHSPWTLPTKQKTRVLHDTNSVLHHKRPNFSLGPYWVVNHSSRTRTPSKTSVPWEIVKSVLFVISNNISELPRFSLWNGNTPEFKQIFTRPPSSLKDPSFTPFGPPSKRMSRCNPFFWGQKKTSKKNLSFFIFWTHCRKLKDTGPNLLPTQKGVLHVSVGTVYSYRSLADGSRESPFPHSVCCKVVTIRTSPKFSVIRLLRRHVCSESRLGVTPVRWLTSDRHELLDGCFDSRSQIFENIVN